ncbi:MAG TPA: amino acid adenylation domain-containing protein [Nevskia sp.]|nr:amino acid adenylation domain-containing protein [Nevskia sp.]
MFQRVVAEMPQRVAIAGDDCRLTGAELATVADRIAVRLQACGVRRGDRVGIFSRPSAQAIAALLGILRCGACYVPFDCFSAPTVQRRIYQDAGLAAMLVEESLCHAATQFWDGTALPLDQCAADDGADSFRVDPVAVRTGDLACIHYVPGAAGLPISVSLSHEALLYFALDRDYVELGQDEVILQLAELSADVSCFEIWGALLNGGCVALMGAQEPGLDQISAAVCRHGVTTLWLPQRLAAHASDLCLERLPSLRRVLAGGDMLAPMQVHKTPDGTPLAAAAPPAAAPLTESQAEIWLAAQLGDDASCAFNDCVLLDLDAAVDAAALQLALSQLLARHDALRACFSASGDAMRIALPWSFELGTAEAESAEVALALEARTPFDLVNGPLIRGRLLSLPQGRRALLLGVHRMVCDGDSLRILVTELPELYAAIVGSRPARLPEAPSFAAYARRQMYVAAAATVEAEAYWTERLTPPPAFNEMPVDQARPAVRSFHCATLRQQLPQDLRAALQQLGGGREDGLPGVMLAAWQALIGRLGAGDDVVVGVPIDGRAAGQDAALVGQCLNLLPLRASWDGTTSIAAHLQAVERSLDEARQHRRCTLGALTRQLPGQRDGGRSLLAQALFRFERLPRQSSETVAVRIERGAKSRSGFDLELLVLDDGDGLLLDCSYSLDLYQAATIERWLDCYQVLLRSFVADPQQRLVQAPLLPQMERARLLFGLNATAAARPRQCLHQLVQAQAARHPGAIAAQYGAARISYGELERRANRLAQHLIARGLRPGGLVGVLLRRSLDLLVAPLACLKAGCAYVPLDPSHPPARLRQVLDRAAPAALITDGPQLQALPPALLRIDLVAERQAIAAAAARPPGVPCDVEDLAYVIFTSGSTGAPKGVEISHRAIVNLLLSMAREPGLAADDVLLATTTISFDIAALELFLPLLVGARVVIAGRREAANGEALKRRLESSRATVLQATPSTWKLLLEAGFSGASLRRMLCGGEALPRELARRLLADGGELWNMYGPTETTVWSSCARVAADAPITVGRMPIDNTAFYILDRHRQPLPTGVPGELYIGGDGVARGYLGDPERSAASFLPDPFTGGRMYRSGDLAQRLDDGTVQLLGRIDRQIKLRGFRIEPDEIESVLLASGVVSAVAVECRADPAGVQRLAAYYVGAPDQDCAPEALRGLLAAQLPDYLVPNAWVRLDELPLTPNGKIDRKALPPLQPASAQDDYVAPRSPLETALAAIWAEVLKLDRVSVHSDLFELGADSIQLFQISARARRHDIRLSARQLMQLRTIARVAAALNADEEGSAGGEPPAPVPPRGAGSAAAEPDHPLDWFGAQDAVCGAG